MIKDCALKESPDDSFLNVSSNVVKDEAWHESIGSDEKCLSFRVDFDAVEKVDSRKRLCS